MIWYKALVYVDSETGEHCPGMGSPATRYVPPGCIVHGYDLEAATCLVGLPVPRANIPQGWLSLSLEQAKDEFEVVEGREPSTGEVY